MSDLIARLEAQALEDDAHLKAARSDDRQPSTMTSIADGAIRAVSRAADALEFGQRPEGIEQFPSTPDREEMNYQIAREKFARAFHVLPRTNEQKAADLLLARQHYAGACSICESPLERYILPWLMFFDWQPFHDGPVPVVLPAGDEPQECTSKLYIVPQLSFGRYRLDYAVVARDMSRSIIVGLECDGAAFHDAVKDRERDAYFAAFRIPIVRSRSLEIRNSPERAVGRVFRLIEAWSESKR